MKKKISRTPSGNFNVTTNFDNYAQDTGLSSIGTVTHVRITSGASTWHLDTTCAIVMNDG